MRKEDLADVLYLYGELRNSRALARTIVKREKIKRLTTSFQLKEVLKKFLPKAKEHKILAQIFQGAKNRGESRVRGVEGVFTCKCLVC